MEAVIKVENLSKAYGPVTAVRKVGFSVGRGEVFGLLGANGAGKSTTMECILGTKRADTGTVSILGMEPHRDRQMLFERVGVQFQEAVWQDRIRVAELCEATAALYRSPLEYSGLLRQFGLAGRLKNPVSELSGGEKQRLSILLALIPNPDVLFLDELTTGLDARARRDVWKILSGLKETGITMLLTSHFMDEVEALCDTILILKRGICVFHGTVREAVGTSACTAFEDAYLWYTDERETDNESI